MNKDKTVGLDEFYSDFISGIDEELKSINKTLTRLYKEKDSIVKNILNDYNQIKGSYYMNDSLIYTPVELEVFLDKYSSSNESDITPAGKSNTFFNKRLVSRLKRLRKVNYKVKSLENDVIELEDCKLSKYKYSEVSKLYNDWSSRFCLDGGAAVFAEGMGRVHIQNVVRTYREDRAPKVNNKASQDYKKVLIKNGKTPYVKADHEKAIAEGKDYDGVEWLIYHYEDTYLYIKWLRGNHKDTTGYKFIPARGNHAFKTVEDAVGYIHDVDDIDAFFDKPLGFVNRMNILKNAIPNYLSKFRLIDTTNK